MRPFEPPGDLDERERAFVEALEATGLLVVSVVRLRDPRDGSRSVRVELTDPGRTVTHAARLYRHGEDDYRTLYSLYGGRAGPVPDPVSAEHFARAVIGARSTTTATNAEVLLARDVVERSPDLLALVDAAEEGDEGDESTLAFYLHERLRLDESSYRPDHPEPLHHAVYRSVSAAVVDLASGAPLEWVLRRHAGWRE